MIARRNFLGGLAGILSAGVAPAIITDAMKISVAQDPNARLVKQAMDELDALARRIHARTSNQAVEELVRSKSAIKVYIDPHANSGQLSGLRRHQQIDTSRGYHLYEIPLVPVGAGKHMPILVPPERRVLRFS